MDEVEMTWTELQDGKPCELCSDLSVSLKEYSGELIVRFGHPELAVLCFEWAFFYGPEEIHREYNAESLKEARQMCEQSILMHAKGAGRQS